jgi:hypothetical protein
MGLKYGKSPYNLDGLAKEIYNNLHSNLLYPKIFAPILKLVNEKKIPKKQAEKNIVDINDTFFKLCWSLAKSIIEQLKTAKVEVDIKVDFYKPEDGYIVRIDKGKFKIDCGQIRDCNDNFLNDNFLYVAIPKNSNPQNCNDYNIYQVYGKKTIDFSDSNIIEDFIEGKAKSNLRQLTGIGERNGTTQKPSIS